MTSNENDKLWEKCARLLMLNSLERLDLFLEIVSQITGNIAQAPSILKFRSLKYSNATINNKIVETIGGIEFFHGVGFQTTVDEQGTKVLRLTIETSEIVEAVENLQIGLHWLTNTVSTCRTCVSRSILLGNGLISCAECTIVVRLPTGVAVTGGFMRGEKLHHVRSFACCYFVEARTNAVRLVLPDSRVEVTEALLDCTLEELQLCPRAVVFASVHSEAQREALMSQKHLELQQSHIKQKTEVKKESKTKVDSRQMLKDEKAKILAAFQDDRSKK